MGPGRVRWPLAGWAEQSLPALIWTVLEHRLVAGEHLKSPGASADHRPGHVKETRTGGSVNTSGSQGSSGLMVQ